MHLDEFLRDAEPEPGAAELAGDRGVSLPELTEDRLQSSFRDSGAAVGHPVMQDIVAKVHRDLDASFSREFQRIPDEVHEALGDAPRVAARERDVVGHGGNEIQPLLRRQRTEGGHDTDDDVLNRVVRQGQLHPTGLDLGEVEHVVDESEQVLAAVLDVGQRDLQVVGYVAIDVAQYQFIEPQDRVQRGAQLMTHARQEIGLGLTGPLELDVERPLVFVELVKLATHLVHPGGQSTELVTVRHADGRPKVTSRDLIEEASGFADGKDERPGDDEPQDEGEEDRRREAAHEKEGSTVRHLHALPEPAHSGLFAPDDPGHEGRVPDTGAVLVEV